MWNGAPLSTYDSCVEHVESEKIWNITCVVTSQTSFSTKQTRLPSTIPSYSRRVPHCQEPLPARRRVLYSSAGVQLKKSLAFHMFVAGSVGKYESGWWFGTFFIFPYIGNNHPNWLIFFRGVAQPPTRNSDDVLLISHCWMYPAGSVKKFHAHPVGVTTRELMVSVGDMLPKPVSMIL